MSINDSSGNYVEQVLNTFTVNPTKGMKMSPTAISWASINLGATNALSGDDPITVNNSGNINISVINVTGYNLHGVTTPAQFIYAANFSAQVIDSCNGPKPLVNGTKVVMNNATAAPGNHTGIGNLTAREDLYFCLEAIEGSGGSLTVQTYDTSTSHAWSIDVG